MNKLILGDNLEILKKMDSESIDLIYLDPPFFSNRNYEVIWGDSGEVRSFQDRWSGGVDHYIAWLKERVTEMHRLLKPTGAIFLHCDWHALAPIKYMILDRLFGENNFKNMIIWQRTNVHNDAKKKLANVCDTIFYYTKSDKHIYKPQYTAYDESYLTKFYKHYDTKGRYRISDLSSPNPRPNLTYEYKGYKPPEKGWAVSRERMEQMDKDDMLVFPKTMEGRIQRKKYLDEDKGVLIGDLWTDIQNVQPFSAEKIGYPTQKPQKLLERIIEMTTNENDVILDPFVGGGTTVAVAEKLNRQWIGIDQSVQAVKVTEMRLLNLMDLFSKPFLTQLHKYDYDTLRYKDAFEFEQFIIHQFGGTPNVKQRNDLGLDGKTLDNIPIQVKRSDNIGRNVIDNFHSAVMRFDKNVYEQNKIKEKPIGYIIAFSFGKGAIQEAARLKNMENIVIQLVKVEDIVAIAKKPSLVVEVLDIGKDKKGLQEMQFKAVGNSEAGIEFYSWDFDYKQDLGFKAEILLDKKGEQSWKFKAGEHTIAVKVVDNEGLENIEIVYLKIK